jgi:hypothetical protein
MCQTTFRRTPKKGKVTVMLNYARQENVRISGCIVLQHASRSGRLISEESAFHDDWILGSVNLKAGLPQ